MNPKTVPSTPVQIYQIVSTLVAQNQPRAYQLTVQQNQIVHAGNWWHVVVTPNKPDINANDYARVMARIENSIEQQYGVKVLLVPAIPD